MPTTVTTTTTTTTTTARGGANTTTVTTTLSSSDVEQPPAPAGDATANDVCLLNTLTETPPSTFPHSLAEITSEWLTEALGATVKSMDLNPSDEGQLGLTVIVNNIVYDSAEEAQASRPSSVAIKIHCQEEGQLGMAVCEYRTTPPLLVTLYSILIDCL